MKIVGEKNLRSRFYTPFSVAGGFFILECKFNRGENK